MRTVRHSLLFLLLAALVTTLVYVVIVNTLRNPLTGTTAHYTATFADVSGVRSGADVRRRGVQVGKVKSVRLTRAGDMNVAELGIELSRSQPVTTATHLTIKFQNLTGSRYIDIRDDDVANARPISSIPLRQTTGSFDITTVFAGLAPVLNTLEPADLNNLIDKLTIFLDGDGAEASGLLDSIRVIADRAADKQQAISTLIQNMSVFSERIRGNSGKLFQNVSLWTGALDKVAALQDDIVGLSQYGPRLIAAINRALWVIGARPGENYDAKFDVLRANLYRVPEFFERMPGVYGGMQPLLRNPDVDTHCTNGTLVLPEMVKVFLNDEQVVLCNRLPQ